MDQPSIEIRKYPTIAACGLDCGLCPRYYTDGPSRCPGCGGPDFFNKHPSCSFITCCVKKKHHEVCAECLDFPCTKFKSEKEYLTLTSSPSYPPIKNILPNLKYIREFGLESFISRQKQKIKLLEFLISKFNDGRSKSFYCRTTALLSIKRIEQLIEMAIKKINAEKIGKDDLKTKARILKKILSINI